MDLSLPLHCVGDHADGNRTHEKDEHEFRGFQEPSSKEIQGGGIVFFAHHALQDFH
jgi:hypothetical protein